MRKRVLPGLAVALAAVAAVAVPWAAGAQAPATSAAPAHLDLSGLWSMRETDRNFEGCLRRTWLEIRQVGDFARIRAWEEHDTWTCEGRGRVDGDRLQFDWRGAGKLWRGTVDLRFDGRELKGTFHRLDVHADVQFCAGARTGP